MTKEIKEVLEIIASSPDATKIGSKYINYLYFTTIIEYFVGILCLGLFGYLICFVIKKFEGLEKED